MGFESVEDMRERIKESLDMQKSSLMPRIKENNIMVELRDRVEGDVPDSLVEQAETSLLQDFFGQLQQAGMTFDAYLASQNITPDQFKADLKAQSADQVKEELALEAGLATTTWRSPMRTSPPSSPRPAWRIPRRWSRSGATPAVCTSSARVFCARRPSRISWRTRA